MVEGRGAFFDFGCGIAIGESDTAVAAAAAPLVVMDAAATAVEGRSDPLAADADAAGWMDFAEPVLLAMGWAAAGAWPFNCWLNCCACVVTATDF